MKTERVHTLYNPIREFDAHVYYRLEDRGSAEALRGRLVDEFRHKAIEIGRMIDRPVGPHPVPMFEINFKREDFPVLLRWLKVNRGNHTVLIHEVTGDDPRDHTTGATWLGSPVELDFSRLDPPMG